MSEIKKKHDRFSHPFMVASRDNPALIILNPRRDYLRCLVLRASGISEDGSILSLLRDNGCINRHSLSQKTAV